MTARMATKDTAGKHGSWTRDPLKAPTKPKLPNGNRTTVRTQIFLGCGCAVCLHARRQVSTLTNNLFQQLRLGILDHSQMMHLWRELTSPGAGKTRTKFDSEKAMTR